MRVSKRNPWLSGLGVLLAVLVMYGGHARADVTTDQSGSIVIFPKVIADGTRDTLIQLTNTSNMQRHAHCFYFDATNDCKEVDFDLTLTPQQPTNWRVSTGRSSGNLIDDPGFFQGNVPLRAGFQGELKCIEVDEFGVPEGGNALKGEALLETVDQFPKEPPFKGQISEYNGIAIQAVAGPTGPVCVGGNEKNGESCTGASDCCDVGGSNCGTCDIQLKLDNSSYNACPSSLVFSHYAEGAWSLFAGATVSTEITLVPCTEDIESGIPAEAGAFFESVDEYEDSAVSANVQFSCWFNERLGDIANIWDTGSNPSIRFFKTRIRPVGSSGLLGVAEEFYSYDSFPEGSAAINLGVIGSHQGGDVITVPTNQ